MSLLKFTNIILLTTFVFTTVFAFGVTTENSFSIKSTKVDVKAILEPNPDFNITSTSTTKDSLNDLVLVGEVKNNAQEEKQFVKVIITAYDENNAILTTDFTFTEPTNLQPGQSGSFKNPISEESVGGDINAVKSLKIAVTSN